jgi:hypothetical protein
MKKHRFLTVAVILGSVAVAIASLKVASAGPPVCPQIYAPVICDNGRVYPNQCVADRHHAHNCVPYGNP